MVVGCNGQNGSEAGSSNTAVSGIAAQVETLRGANPSAQLADKLEDVAAKLKTAESELGKTPPDNQAALGAIEGAVGDLEAAVKDGVLDAAMGTNLMSGLTAAAHQLAARATEQAKARGGNASAITDANTALAEGDNLRASSKYKDAVAKYRAALAKAESA
jgi:hypothetical protein